jgi:alpha-tubulin suppressor-like RCC1 family protein
VVSHLREAILFIFLIFTLPFYACDPNEGGPKFFDNVKAVSVSGYSAGEGYTVAVKNDGTLWAWGSNYSGQLGIGSGDNNPHPNPVQIGADTDWDKVSAGHFHTVAIKRDGTLWAWGSNGEGQLGNGAWGDSYIPVQVVDPGPWREVSAGINHTAAIKNDYELWTWGLNDDAQLGDGNWGTSSNVPVKIDGVWKTVSSYGYIAAIKNDGKLYRTDGSGIFVLVVADDDWDRVFDDMTAIKNNGTLWRWGGNVYGQLGDGTTNDTYYYFPVQVVDPGPWKEVSAGGFHTVAIKSDGTLWAWGSNSSGRLGVNTIASSSLPVRIGKDRWIRVSAGAGHTVAIKSDGTLWSWGINSYGQLGDGTTKTRGVPIKVIQSLE